MTRSFGLVDYKVLEAEHFLLQMQALGPRMDFLGMQFRVSAFVSAARSITFTMQASLKGEPKFERWYEARQASLRKDALAKFFHDFRTVTQHIGVNVVSAGAGDKDGMRYYFMPCRDLPIVPEQDVLSACQSYFVSILQLVFDCYVELGAVVDGQQYFTRTNFATLGGTVEDAEQELGFPPGWTDLGISEIEPHRWEALRKQADGCLIEQQFERWLQKSLSRSGLT